MNARLAWSRDGLDWPHREASRFVKAGGLTWHVQSFGEGPALLLIHGTGASTHSWREVAPQLQSRFRVIVPDLPGHAFSDPLPGSQATLPGMAEAIDALLTALGVRVEFVVGHSAGAAIAIRMCLDGRIKPRCIIGSNAALLPFGGFAEQLFPSLARLLVLNPFAPRLFTWQATDLMAVRRVMESTGSRLTDEGLRWYQRLFRSTAHVEATLGMMAHWDLAPLRDGIGSLGVPLTLIVGKSDKAVSPEDARRIKARLPSTQIRYMPNCGHLCHEEQPSAFAETLLSIVAEHGLCDAI